MSEQNELEKLRADNQHHMRLLARYIAHFGRDRWERFDKDWNPVSPENREQEQEGRPC